MVWARRKLRQWRDAESGLAAAELAMVLPLLVTFMFGIVEVGRLFWMEVSLRQAVEQTARHALAEFTRESQAKNDADFTTWLASWNGSLETQADAEVYGWDASGVTFTATTSTSGGIEFVTIDASLIYDNLFSSWVQLGPITLTAQSRVPLIRMD